ncbi:MAG: 4-hydroxy-tetrahydrodipicolinate reductase [Tunicatimonas sp.]
MHILLLGYGKMGRTIETLATARGHSTTAVDNDQRARQSALDDPSVDVAIEFSQPDAAVDNILGCLERGIPVLSGTTGWLDRRVEVDDYCRQRDGTFFYASNYSIGVNLFFRLNRWLAETMAPYPDYQPTLEEIHHTQKKDAPSGTALTLVEGMLPALPTKSGWVLQEEEEVKAPEDQLVVHSVREGDVPGTHIVRYRSEVDGLEIKHEAYGRQGFAQGALRVAEWLPNHKGVLGMDDFLPL